jgi:hypothetical protein
VTMLTRTTADKAGDPRLRLEKYLAEVYVSLASAPDSALAVWAAATVHYKSSYLAWTGYTDALMCAPCAFIFQLLTPLQ